eukprot:569058-Alexandrium_andersonii.AAC.1
MRAGRCRGGCHGNEMTETRSTRGAIGERGWNEAHSALAAWQEVATKKTQIRLILSLRSLGAERRPSGPADVAAAVMGTK